MMNGSQAMACPIDGTTLVMSERQGIEIDYCPTCRGVWLDRGELDKIIERSGPAAPAQPQRPAPDYARHGGAQHGGFGHGSHHKPYKKRKSWIEEIFD